MKIDSIICLSDMNWDFMRQRPQQLMTALAAHYPVLYVRNGQDLIKHLIRRIKGEKHHYLEKIDTQLYALSPIRFLSVRRYPFLHKIFREKMIANIVNDAKKLGFHNSALWIYSPSMSDMIGCFGEKIVIYDCVDDHAQFSPEHAEAVQCAEDIIIKKADKIIVTADELYKKLKSKHSDITIIRNGVEYKHFAIPDKKPSIKKVLGFIGAVYNWVDVELIIKLAKKFSQHEISIVGPLHDAHAKELRRLSNITLHGLQKYECLPKFLHAFDICLIPFVISKLTLSVNPVKLYEYFASGKPVVSTPLPEVMKFSPYVYTANTHEDFIRTVETALMEDNLEIRNERRKIAFNNSWEARATEILTQLNRVNLETH